MENLIMGFDVGAAVDDEVGKAVKGFATEEDDTAAIGFTVEVVGLVTEAVDTENVVTGFEKVENINGVVWFVVLGGEETPLSLGAGRKVCIMALLPVNLVPS